MSYASPSLIVLPGDKRGERAPHFKPTPGFEGVEFPDSSTLSKPIDWPAMFGRMAHLSVEIGCGGGRWLIGAAESNPEKNYVGLEIAGEFYNILRERSAKRGLKNLKVARIDGAWLMRDRFADNSIDEYHIYFPDPWPKKRHNKRRLLSDEFCAQLQRTLKPGGILWFATDHKEYYSVVLPRLAKVLPVQEHPEPWPDAPAGRTNFEAKYIVQGRPIYRLFAKKP